MNRSATITVRASEAIRWVLRVLATIVVAVPSWVHNTVLDAGSWTEGWLLGRKKASYGIAVARIALAVSSLGILASNYSTRFYTWGSGGAWSGDIAIPRSDFPHIWLFGAFQAVRENPLMFTLLYFVVAALAVLVLLGYRMRFILPLFLILWVGLVELQDMIGDQGDNMFRIAMLLMLFTDTSKRWSLDARRRAAQRRRSQPESVVAALWGGWPVIPGWFTNLTHNLAVVALAAQICMVYVSGALYKVGGLPWQNGTAIYAPLHTARFGTWPELSSFVTDWAPLVAVLSIGSVLAQVVFAGALLNKWTRRLVLVAMLSFHAGIGLLMGLPWFSLTMVAIDAIFIRDRSWAAAAGWVRRSGRMTVRLPNRTGLVPPLVEGASVPESPLVAEAPQNTESQLVS